MKSTPNDLKKVLTTKALITWKELTPVARMDFVSWIEGAKQPETRKRRIARANDMLISGKRRPCCYAVVPMDLYSALAKNPKAQAHWKLLTPLQKREFTAWIGTDTKNKKERVEKVCSMLARKKNHP